MADAIQNKITTKTRKYFQINLLLQQKSQRKNEFLVRSAENFKKTLKQTKDTPTINTDQILQWLTQGILDLTYYQENILVDEEFPEDDGRKRLCDILEYLNEPEELLKELFGNEKKPVDVLGNELVETLNWRKGALLYMYCCVQREKETITDKNFYKQCLEDGVTNLQRMLDVRRPIDEEWKDVLGNDKETFELLSKGIFSDTHVLALMYAGEMCYWFCQDIPSCDQKSEDFNPKLIGQSLLQKYVDLVNGPLKDKGWNSSRANELLEEINKR